MSALHIEMCPETGICSIHKADGVKVDLMPDEAKQVQAAAGDPAKIKSILADVDPAFAEALKADELARLSSGLT